MKKKTSDWTELLSNAIGVELAEVPTGGKSIADLSEEWCVSDTSARRNVRKLLKEGLIEKHVVKDGPWRRAYFTIVK